MADSISSKKGVSMVELIAYVALYGVVMSLLATLVFVLVTTTRKINRQSILNKGTKMLYTDFLAQAISFNADYVVLDEPTSNTVSVTLEKRFRYNDEGERIKIVAGDEEYANKPVKLTYSYTNNEGSIKDIIVTYTKLNGDTTSGKISLDYGMTITSSSENDADLSKVFTLINKNASNKSLVFNGKLNYDGKSLEFNFVVPVYIASEE